MKIRILSDLHVDVNQTVNFGFNDKLDRTDVTLIAGDVAGDSKIESLFLSSLKTSNPIICVGGNHLGYNYNLRKENDPVTYNTKEYCLQQLKQLNPPVHYLENRYIKVKDKVIYGGTMYSNFELYGDPDLSIKVAESYMNDFKYVKTMQEEGVRNIRGYDYRLWFIEFIEGLKRTLEETTEDIIVVSHFAPSPQSISEEYQGGFYRGLNPAYCSNMEGFIKRNPRIKLWAHGHMHDTFDYMIGECRVVCEPYGYRKESGIVPSVYEGKVLSFR